MKDVPRSRDAKHPVLRQLITPFYRTRMRKARSRTEDVRDNLATVRRARSADADVKALRKAGILK